MNAVPFWYHIPVPSLPHGAPGLVWLAKWLLPEGAEFHVGTGIAILETPTGRFMVQTNGDGFLREKLLSTGAEAPTGTLLATADADGEKLPYGRPCSIAQRC
jgi:pyruvate/2-oxoglutarate dehydrogenase complex dihydrolipoamide acyltransferase (E2) component